MTSPDLMYVVGEALVDVVIDGDARREHAGGSPMNVAYGLARLGLATCLRTHLGRDDAGRLLEAHLESAGVDIATGSFGEAATSKAIATIQADRHAEYEFEIEWAPEAMEIPEGARVAHTGSIASVLDPGADAVARAFAAAPAGALLSLDPNVRPQIAPDREAVSARIDRLAGLVHVLKLSDEDAAWLHPGLPHDAVLDHYLDAGASVVAMTRGGEGCLIASRTDRLTRAALPVDVVDTIGAGDAFMSGLLYGIVSAGLDEAVREGAISGEELAALADTALRSARVAVSRAGANPPTLAELVAPA